MRIGKVRQQTLVHAANKKLAFAVGAAAWAVAGLVVIADMTSGRPNTAPEFAAFDPTADAPVVYGAAADNQNAEIESSFSEAAAELKSEAQCLAQAIYHEARSETYAGQLAVAEVVMNRVASRRYPNSVCGVVFQGHKRRTGCQFTFTCDGSLKSGEHGLPWAQSQKLAWKVMFGLNDNVSDSATHYHAVYVNPVWAKRLKRTVKIGRHIFYRPHVRSASRD